MANGKTTAQACKEAEIVEQTYFRWRKEYGRYGYRRITALLQLAGWLVGKDRVERIWRREGLKVPKRQKPRRRLWLNDGSCVRLRPMHEIHSAQEEFDSRLATALHGMADRMKGDRLTQRRI